MVQVRNGVNGCLRKGQTHSDVGNLWRWVLHAIVCTLFLSVTCTSTDFLHTPVKIFSDVVFSFLHWTTVTAAIFCVTMFLAMLPKYLFASLYTLVLFVSAILAYFRYTIGFSFNAMILDIVFQNDWAVSVDFITLPLVLWVVVVSVAGWFLAIQRKRYSIPFKYWATWLAVGVTVVLAFVLFSPDLRFWRPVVERIPFNIFRYSYNYLEGRQEVATVRPRQCSYADYVGSSDSLQVVVVVGESLRPGNLSLNGYHRCTTPELQSLGVVSFDSVFSDYAYTNESVPHLMTRADTQHPERAYSERSFIDVFKAAGVHTASISNQDTERSYVYFFTEADTTIYSNQSKNSYNFDKWLDGDVLPHYHSLLGIAPQQLIVIHTIGSHWWYNVHFSDEYERFKPVMQSRILSNCDSMEVINSYDNTVLYTDYVVSEIIRPLQNRNAILIFLSDHGEALGEDGHWLHASASPMMNYTAAFVWMSERYKELHPGRFEAVGANCHTRCKTDILYHTVIDAADISTDVLDTALSVLR